MAVHVLGMRKPRRAVSAYPPDLPGEDLSAVAQKRKDLLQNPDFKPFMQEIPDDEKNPGTPDVPQPAPHGDWVDALKKILQFHANEAQKSQDAGAVEDKKDQINKLEGEQ